MVNSSLTRLCNKCKIEKPITEFYFRSKRKHLVQGMCKQCKLKYAREWYSKNKSKKLKRARKWSRTEKGKNHSLKKDSGNVWDFALFNEKFNEQKGLCAICKKHQSEFKTALHADHCHKGNIPRGLLCRKCNSMIGFADDDIAILNSAIKYLLEYS